MNNYTDKEEVKWNRLWRQMDFKQNNSFWKVNLLPDGQTFYTDNFSFQT